VPPEIQFDEKWDRLVDVTLRRVVYGTLIGGAAALTLLRGGGARGAAVAFGAGWGAGSAWTTCSKDVRAACVSGGGLVLMRGWLLFCFKALPPHSTHALPSQKTKNSLRARRPSRMPEKGVLNLAGRAWGPAPPGARGPGGADSLCPPARFWQSLPYFVPGAWCAAAYVNVTVRAPRSGGSLSL
jgi:hypothetical protein